MASSAVSSASSVSSSTRTPSTRASKTKTVTKQTIIVNGSMITVVPSKGLIRKGSTACTRTVVINGQKIKVAPSKILSIKLDIPPTKAATTQASASAKKKSTKKTTTRTLSTPTPAKRCKKTLPEPTKDTVPKTASSSPSTTVCEPEIVCKKILARAAKAAAPKKSKQASTRTRKRPADKSPALSKNVRFSAEVEVKHFLTKKPVYTVQAGPETVQKLKR